MRGFVLGVVFTLVALSLAAYLFIREGKFPMATSAKPLPFERTIANMAINANIGKAAEVANPLPVNDANIVSAVKEYKEHCIFCHGTPGQQHPPLAEMMFPHPPQLFEKDDMVVDDPSGAVYWVITNGIRLSAMPGFGRHLSDDERWKLVMLLTHADKLPAAAKAEFARKEANQIMAPGHEHEHEDEHEHNRGNNHQH